MSERCWSPGCDADSVVSVGGEWCVAHWTAMLDTFSPASFPTSGYNLPTGPRDDDGFAPCRCARCGATTALYDRVAPFTACRWCVSAFELQLQHQAELVLAPPEIDHDDAGFAKALDAWAERLERAVDADVIERWQADRAWRQEVARAAAA